MFSLSISKRETFSRSPCLARAAMALMARATTNSSGSAKP